MLMNSRGVVRAILLGVGCAFLCAACLSAQSPTDPPNCPLTPYQAELLRHLSHHDERPQVFIDSVEFEGPTHLPASARQELVSRLQQQEIFAGEDLSGEVESSVRGAWQDQGYFQVQVQALPQFVRGDEKQQHYSVSVWVDEGIQYRMGNLRVVNANPDDKTTVFPPETLRQQIPVQRGDLFSSAKIWQGLEALRKLYGTKGYIDFTSTTVTQVDPERQVVNLTLEFDQQRQYGLGTVEVIGGDPTTEAFLKSVLKSGEVFDSEKLDDLLRKNKGRLPADVQERRMEFRRDVKTGSVNLRFDLRPCPNTEESAVRPR
jgi:outer membrane protein assembly factor BamA